MATGLKERILSLREKGFSYKKIADELKCSKATISYHCQRNSINNIGLRRLPLTDKEINEIKEYYKTHTAKDTSEKYDVSLTTIKTYVDNKRTVLSNEEKIKHHYINIKNFRQRMKIKAVEYKGGKCIRCGYDKCMRSLTFHHRNPNEKEFGIGTYSNLGWNAVKKELDKCDLLCNNCHGEVHENLDKKTDYIPSA